MCMHSAILITNYPGLLIIKLASCSSKLSLLADYPIITTLYSELFLLVIFIKAQLYCYSYYQSFLHLTGK